MSIPCRVLPHLKGDGPENMATDEALLESVARHPDSAVVRTYEWTVPTLTLGYFQPLSLVESESRWRGVAVLRRPTGGGAIMHDREVTYAVVLPRTHPLSRRSGDLYNAIHGALIRLIESRGVVANRRADVEPPYQIEATRPLLCFLDRDPEDVLCGGSKVIGSAQRRRAGAILQHGSILLQRSDSAPELPGLTDLSGLDGDRSVWAEAIRETLPVALGLSATESELLPDEAREAETLANVVYRGRAWNERR